MLRRSAVVLLPAAILVAKRKPAMANVVRCSAFGNLAQDAAVEHRSREVDPIRVVTYNVRRFKSKDGSNTAPAIGDALARLQPTVVAFNEVDVALRPEALDTVAAALGGFNVAFFGHVCGRYGNAVLSKFPIVATRQTHLRGGTEVKFAPGTKKYNGEIAKEGEVHRISRGLLECDIEVPVNSEGSTKVLTVAVTHLDHISEEQREIQLAHILEAVGPHRDRSLIVGDLNALNRNDYSDQEWKALEDRAVANKWSAPQNGCLKLVQSKGFVDSFAASRGPGPLAERSVAASDPIFTAHVGHPMYRIDYCFAANASGLGVLAANVHSEIHLSDHFPVSFDFRVQPLSARL